MASRRVSISALLCEDETSPPRGPTQSVDSARQRSSSAQHHPDLYRAAFPPPQPPPRRTPSPDLPHSSLYTWPSPSTSRGVYNPPQGMFPSVQSSQYEPQSPPLRTSQQSQVHYNPPSSPHLSYSQSPFSTTRLSSDSPSSTISLPRPPSIHSPSSPILYTQRLAPSPGGYFYTTPSSGSPQYDPSFHPALSPTVRHPRHSNHPEPIASSSMPHTSLSRISTSSFPQALLNPVSPQQSPLGGLEALVQAATVERDRLEAKAHLDRKADVSRSTVRRSPELHFRSTHEAPRSHLQAPAPRTPITPSLIPGPLLRDSYSESSLRIGASPEAHPPKRQRQSDPHPAPDNSWVSSSQPSLLIGPGIKPRRPSFEARTELRPTLPISSREKEEALSAGSRVSPTRERSARRQYMTEEEAIGSHISGHRRPITSALFAPGDDRHVLAAEGPPLMVHQDIRLNVDLPPSLPRVSHADLVMERQNIPPSPPPRTLLAPSESPAPRHQSPSRVKEKRWSPQVQHSSLSDILAPEVTTTQMIIETESATGPETLMDATVSRSLAMQDPPVALVGSLPPDSPTSVVQDKPVIPSTPIVYDVNPDHVEPVEPPSPTLPSPNADPAAQGFQLPPGVPRLGSLPREDVLNLQSSEPEPLPPPPTASPSPRALTPVSGFQDGINADQSVGVGMAAVSGTSTVTPLRDPQNPVDTQASPTLHGEPEPEAVDSSVDISTAAEAFHPPVSDSPPRTDHPPIPIINEIKIETDVELDVAMDTGRSHIAERTHADMEIDEGILSPLANDFSSRSMPRKQESSSSEDKPSPSHHPPLKLESALGTPTPSHPSPSPSSFAVNLEGVSTLSPDTAVSTRESETSTLKLEERPTQRKKSKQHAQPKSRAKPSGSAKTKLKVSSDAPSIAPPKSKKPLTTGTKKSVIAVRSRSTSVMPVNTTPAPGVESRAAGEAELEDAEEGMEDKLYCICNTGYDDERVMIACDRCDEWYHTSCVNMPDLEVDLVDQFICPLCVEKNPHLDLRTTWKRRCLNGLKQHDPASPDACHKPARGAFSKYCSDECGVQYMHMRISLWIEKGGNRDRLWETVKNAEKREGVVVSACLKGQSRSPAIAGDQPAFAIVLPKISKADRELARLRARLDTLVQKREALKAEMDVIAWREKVTELAIQHADMIEQCGWDQRLCFGEEEVAEFGASVLESYEENHTQADVDETQEEAEWWCMGKKKCDRHSGWQKLRIADVEFDKETKDQALQKLTKLEREIRKRVEDILDPHAHLDKAKMLEPSSPRVPVLSRSTTVNGQPKHKPNGDQTKKGKKRKE